MIIALSRGNFPLPRDLSLFFTNHTLFEQLLIFINCKKEALERNYQGTFHEKSDYFIHNYYPVAFDSITMEPTQFMQSCEPAKKDTTYVGSIEVEIYNDSIFFETGLRFPLNDENIYRLSFPGYTFYTYTLVGDSLIITESGSTDRLGHCPGSWSRKFIGLKQ